MDKYLTLYTKIIAASNKIENIDTKERAAIVAEGLVNEYGTEELWGKLFHATCYYLEVVRIK